MSSQIQQTKQLYQLLVMNKEVNGGSKTLFNPTLNMIYVKCSNAIKEK